MLKKKKKKIIKIILDITFNCLGSWPAPNNSYYIALLDTRVGGDRRPQYRCGVS